MRNPFLINRGYTIAYAAAWILVAGVHAAVLWLVVGLEPFLAVADSLVFNLLFAGIGLSLWYSIRFYNAERDNFLGRFVNHSITAVLVLGAWIGICFLILDGLFNNQPGYHAFLTNSLLWRSIVGFFLYSLVVMIYYLYINSEDRKARIKKESGMQLQVREAEIERLKAQINPHFLFNSLNSVSSLILTKPEDAREMLVRLSGFLRYSLETRSSGLTTMEKELENIRYYLEIEKVRFGNRLLFEINVPPECMQMTIPHMILQPLVENSIKHGVYESTAPVGIDLVAACHDRRFLHVEVSNDFDPEAPPRKGKGIGLINTQNRLKLAYDCDHCLEVRQNTGRFTVKLTIPQEQTDANTR